MSTRIEKIRFGWVSPRASCQTSGSTSKQRGIAVWRAHTCACNIDGRPSFNPTRGRWDGEVLVIETTNFNGKHAQAGRPTLTSSEHQSLIERFTRVDAETLLYEYTVTDQATWAAGPHK